ncbi:discoidin domain-containing protein [Lysinibacillus sp. NPDC092081]|uniref:discoidin domain-containing protein n=1 Tax=Lysinibacillus sp. NPDC092081 TaxID=3364131 RepID=UPI003822F53E
MNIIDARWTKNSSFTATNATTEVMNTISGRTLGEGIFYFELTTPDSGRMINRWIGFVSVDKTNYNQPNSHQILWQPQLDTVYGIEVDLTAPSTPRYRYRMNGGSFSSLIDIKGSNGVPLSIIKPAIGSADSSNSAIPFTINAGQESFVYPYIVPNLYSFDGKQKMSYENSTLILHDSEYKKFTPKLLGKDPTINAVPNMTSNTAPTGSVTARGAYTPAWQAFDRNSSTYWYDNGSSESNPSWLQYEFDSPKIINKIALDSLIITGSSYGLKEFTLLGSNDGLNYDSLLSVNNHPNSNAKVTYHFNNNNEYLFYKLQFGLSYYSYYTLVSSFEMYEMATTDTPAYWSTVSHTLPSSTQFLNKGMDNLSPLFDRTITQLEPIPMNQRNDILVSGEVGKVFSKTLDMKKYFDIRSIRTEVR